MKIIILHHHLNPGGVTRVIQSQINSLQIVKPDLRINVLAGDGTLTNADVTLFSPLNYLTTEQELDTGYHFIYNVLSQLSSDDIIHIHNPNLGKNPLLTLAIFRLAQSGYNIVFHTHDFAEDRPLNYNFLERIISGHFGEPLSEVMYPDFDNCRFAVLTHADKKRLERYGIAKEKIYLLPNPIQPPRAFVDARTARNSICQKFQIDPLKKIITYPVRVIRRKNIGEFILLATLFEKQANWLVTQPPLNPVEIEHYKKWRFFCDAIKSKIIFDAGTQVDFDQLMFASDFCVTTSIQEGFGMVFLEPWLYNTPVIGRNLGSVTLDFVGNGVAFNSLYEELLTPEASCVDFKELNVDAQQTVIQKVKSDKTYRHDLLKLNPRLANILQPADEKSSASNKSIIETKYSLEQYGHELVNIYQTFSR